jgi:hypothetical protein
MELVVRQEDAPLPTHGNDAEDDARPPGMRAPETTEIYPTSKPAPIAAVVIVMGKNRREQPPSFFFSVLKKYIARLLRPWLCFRDIVVGDVNEVHEGRAPSHDTV